MRILPIQAIDLVSLARSALVLALILIAGFSCYVALFSPSTGFIEAVDISSLPLGGWDWYHPLFLYQDGSNPTGSIVTDESQGDDKFIRVEIDNPNTYSGFAITMNHSVPADASLRLVWRSWGVAAPIIVDIMDGSPSGHGAQSGENFMVTVPVPGSDWTTTEIPFGRFTRNEFQSEGAPEDGIFDTDGIRRVSFTFAPGSQIRLDLKDIRFVWSYTRWRAFLVSAMLGILGFFLLARSQSARLAIGSAQSLFSTAVTCRIVFALLAVAVVLSSSDRYLYGFLDASFLTYVAFVVVIGLDEIFRFRLMRSPLWSLRYVVILFVGWLLNVSLDPRSLFFLLLAAYIPVIESRSRIFFLTVPCSALLALFLNPERLSPYPTPNGAMFIGATAIVAALFQEILRYRLARAESEHATSLYEDLFNKTSESIYTLDQAGLIQKVNPGFEKLIGLREKEIVGRDVLDFIHPGDHAVVQSQRESIASDQSVQYEVRFLHVNGEKRYTIVNEHAIYHDDRLVGYQAIATDITEHRRMEEALWESERKHREELRRSQQLYRDAIDVMDAVPYYQDYNSDEYGFVGSGIERLTGYSPQEFTRRLFSEIVEETVLLGELEGLSLDEAIERVRSASVSTWRADYLVRTRTGERRWLSNAAVQVRDEQGVAVGSLGILQDITDRKRAAEDRARLEEQLRHSQKMEAIGQLAGGVAHDLNNLLMGILGNLWFAEREAPPEVRECLVTATDAAKRAAKLVEQLLTFSRKSRVELKPIALDQIIREVHRLARQTIDRRIDMRIRIDGNLPKVYADASQINSILMNLCVNARDAITEIIRGDAWPDRRNDDFLITIEAETTQIGEEYCKSHPDARPGRFVLVTVSDNGAGMDAETRQRAFEPFFTTKDHGKGTGLGLATVYGIVKQHQGWVYLYSQAGKGTVFRVYLPVAQEEAEESAWTDADPPCGGTETILLVDDEEMIRGLGRRILEPYGYTVLLAQDGKEGLDLYLKEKDRIDLVILDLSMPRLSGHEVLERIRAVSPGAKVIISSGYADHSLNESVQRQNPSAYVTKPYDPLDLARVVRKVLNGQAVLARGVVSQAV